MWKLNKHMGEGMACISLEPKYYQKTTLLFRWWMTFLHGYTWDYIEG